MACSCRSSKIPIHSCYWAEEKWQGLNKLQAFALPRQKDLAICYSAIAPTGTLKTFHFKYIGILGFTFVQSGTFCWTRQIGSHCVSSWHHLSSERFWVVTTFFLQFVDFHESFVLISWLNIKTYTETTWLFYICQYTLVWGSLICITNNYIFHTDLFCCYLACHFKLPICPNCVPYN